MFTIPHKPPVDWKSHVEIARKHAQRLARFRKGQRGPLPDHVLTFPAPDEKRCEATARSTGQQCKQYRVDGGTRCVMHGGLRQNPYHKGNARAYLNGTMQAHTDHLQARNKIRNHPDRHRAAEVLRENGIPASTVNVARTIEAWAIDDGGRTWRRVLKELCLKHGKRRRKDNSE